MTPPATGSLLNLRPMSRVVESSVPGIITCSFLRPSNRQYTMALLPQRILLEQGIQVSNHPPSRRHRSSIGHDPRQEKPPTVCDHADDERNHAQPIHDEWREKTQKRVERCRIERADVGVQHRVEADVEKHASNSCGHDGSPRSGLVKLEEGENTVENGLYAIDTRREDECQHSPKDERVKRAMESSVEIAKENQRSTGIDDHVRRQKRREVEPPKQHDAEQQRGTEVKGRERHSVGFNRLVAIYVVTNHRPPLSAVPARSYPADR